jgi:hypothetical protein
MVGVAVGEEDELDLPGGRAGCREGFFKGCPAGGDSGIDQHKSVVQAYQVAVDKSELDGDDLWRYINLRLVSVSIFYLM